MVPAAAPGKPNSPRWPPRPAWRSASVTCHQAPANGTRSNTACSPRSAATGAARPLESLETIINLIGATTTTTGLTVTAQLDTGEYPTRVKIGDREIKDLPISHDTRHPDWNYTLHPTRRDTP